MPMYSVSLRVLPTSTSRLEGEIIFILVTFLSMISAGMSNSSTMHSGMAPPHGCTALIEAQHHSSRDALQHQQYTYLRSEFCDKYPHCHWYSGSVYLNKPSADKKQSAALI